MCLAEKVRQSGEPFAIAHCNFGLRGADSDGDETFVRSWAAGHSITCHVKRFETSAYAASEGISIEMAARRLRYHWFGELCREHGYSGVAVAHNANDNAETLILNLLRGTGVRGIIGMKASGFIPDPDFADVPLLRPLLGMTREDIAAEVQNMIRNAQQPARPSQPAQTSSPSPITPGAREVPSSETGSTTQLLNTGVRNSIAEAVNSSSDTTRRQLLQETTQMRAQLDDYQDNLTEVSDKMKRTNHILNVVLIVLIIALSVVLVVVIYWVLQSQGVLG